MLFSSEQNPFRRYLCKHRKIDTQLVAALFVMHVRVGLMRDGLSPLGLWIALRIGFPLHLLYAAMVGASV